MPKGPFSLRDQATTRLTGQSHEDDLAEAHGVGCSLVMLRITEEGKHPLVAICGESGRPIVCRNLATPTTAPYSLKTGAPLEPLAKSAVMSRIVTSVPNGA